MNPFFQFDEKIENAAEKALQMCAGHFAEIERVKEYNQQKMLKAFQQYGVSESMFAGTTGYGFDDRGRDTLDKIYAYAFDAEDALARHNFMSGTHTLTVALFGMLRPGDEMLCVTGTPYDTIQPVIGITECSGSLKDFGVRYSEIALKADGSVDLEAVGEAVAEKRPKMVYIQRSKGYATRPSLRIKEIKEICDVVKSASPETIIMLDNCYGEFTEIETPMNVGVDIMAGSMIKNAVHQDDGMLGFQQGTGKEPKESQPTLYDKIPDFDDFGIGCFLLCGSEVYKLSPGEQGLGAKKMQQIKK